MNLFPKNRDEARTEEDGPDPVDLTYTFCDDWFIFGEDDRGELWAVSTELWPHWIEAAAAYYGLAPNSDDALKAANRLTEDVPHAVKHFMLPLAKKHWDHLDWFRVPTD